MSGVEFLWLYFCESVQVCDILRLVSDTDHNLKHKRSLKYNVCMRLKENWISAVIWIWAQCECSQYVWLSSRCIVQYVTPHAVALHHLLWRQQAAGQGYQRKDRGGNFAEMGVQYPPHTPGGSQHELQTPGQPTPPSFAYLGHPHTSHPYSKSIYTDLNCSNLHAAVV